MMDLKELASLTESLKGANLRRYAPPEIEVSLQKLTDIYPMLAIDRSAHQMWFRGRLCSSRDGYPSLLDCIYPRAELLKDFGRANYPGEPACYGGWNWNVVLGELRAGPGQFVQVIAVRPRPGVNIPHHTLGDYEHITNSGGSLVNSHKMVEVVSRMIQELQQDEHLKIMLIDGFLADQFSHSVAQRYEYKLTAAFAKYVFGKKAGLMYPSVEVRGGINIAVPSQMFDEHFEVVCTWVLEVTDYFGHSAYKFRLRRFGCDFEQDGNILWNSKKEMKFTHILQGGMQPLEHVQGWQVPR